MREETLFQIRDIIKQKEEANEQYNAKVRRFRELQKDSKVQEFIQLWNRLGDTPTINIESKQNILRQCIEYYVRKIREEDTNGIFVYMGTYMYSSAVDIVHGASDIPVDKNSPFANFRRYQDIERIFSIEVPIEKCAEFEQTHIIIEPETFEPEEEYARIQNMFFQEAVKTSQEKAKTKVLTRYANQLHNHKQ